MRLRVSLAVFLGVVVLFSSSEDAIARRFFRRTRAVPASASKPETVPTAAPTSSEPAEEPAEPPAIAIDPRQAMADIMALRAAHSGPATIADEEEFAGALERLIAEKHGELVTPAEPAGDALPTAEMDSLTALRAALRHFEQRAAELEAEKAYAEADAARETAAGLRREVRRLDP